MPATLVKQMLAGKNQFDIDDEGPLEELAKKFKSEQAGTGIQNS